MITSNFAKTYVCVFACVRACICACMRVCVCVCVNSILVFLFPKNATCTVSLCFAPCRIQLQQEKSSSMLVLYHFVDSPSSISADPIIMIRRLTAQVSASAAGVGFQLGWWQFMWLVSCNQFGTFGICYFTESS